MEKILSKRPSKSKISNKRTDEFKEFKVQWERWFRGVLKEINQMLRVLIKSQSVVIKKLQESDSTARNSC